MAEWTCESCVHYPPSSFGGKPCWMCNTNDPLLNRYEKREEPVITNADRIRAMTVEELAVFIDRSDCPPDDWTCEKDDKSCTRCWLDWLKSPVSDAKSDEGQSGGEYK